MEVTKNKIKAIVFDLDGTLLNSRKEVTERRKKAILQVHKKGIIVIFATARAPRSVKVLLPPELREISAIVYYNGALIMDEAKGYKDHYPIESAIVEEIIEFLSDCPSEACLSIESEDIWYSNKAKDYSKAMNAVINPIILPLDELKKKSASKILITHYPDYEKFKKQFEQKVNAVCTDAGTLIQIMAKDVSKERAVLNLCVRLNISLSNVMAFGDDWNDLGLFNACGFPIAMENAIPELKEVAFFVTKSNNKDGVAQVVERLEI